MEWSKEQDKAIRSIGKNTLVNAGAGSGKTAVLTEHVIFLLKHGIKLEKLLVLTFTNLAANEMKTRIRDKLSKNVELSHLVNKIDYSHIETFDAFALFLVKKYHYELGLNKNLGILDQTVEQIQKRKILDEIFDSYYESRPQIFVDMVSEFIDKNDANIKDFVIEIENKISLMIDKHNYIEKVKNYFYSDKFMSDITNILFDIFQYKLSEIMLLIYGLDDADDASAFEEIINVFTSCRTYDELQNALKMDIKYPRMPVGSASKKIRDKIKERIRNLKERNFGTSDNIKSFLNSKKDYAQLFIEIVTKMKKKLDDFKLDNNLYSFNDIQFMALSLIRDKKLIGEIRDSFDYILVDEYQDTSDIQEQVIKALEKDNVFMVGDVKQSIYGFRSANCTIFQNKYDLYKLDVEGTKIDMNANYRSRKEFINDLNDMFSILMDKKSNIIDYKADHIVQFGNKNYENLIAEQHYGIEEIDYKKEDDLNNNDLPTLEATIIAEDIIRKINNKHLVVGKDDSGASVLRPCTYSDFTIIMDRGNEFDTYKKIFTSYNIPLLVFSDENITSSSILSIFKHVLNLLNILSNNLEKSANGFIHSFVSLARSFIYSYSDQEIYDMVNGSLVDDSLILKDITKIMEETINSSLKDIIENIIDKYHLYENIAKIGDYISNSTTIEKIVSLASSLDESLITLSDFVTYFDDINKYDIEIKLQPVVDSDNTVKIMNIHKSKGLEFSICYFSGLYKKFYEDFKTKSLLISNDFGLILANKEENDNKQNVLKFIESFRLEKINFEEKLRLFYVALTRSKENAILIRGIGEDRMLKFSSSKSFEDFLVSNSYHAHHVIDYVPLEKSINRIAKDEPIELVADKLEISKFEMSKETMVSKRASLVNVDPDIKELLELGEKIHYLLEICDYETKDVSFIKDEKLRNYVKRALGVSLFENVKNSELRHEFDFYDEKNNIHGIIDCLIIKDDRIDIIDFKLKNIDKEAYVKQLAAYKSYIEKISTKPIRTFLLSVIDAKVEEIKI
jgi:ATP-dependent helicase/nuclease subunit A